MLHSLFMSSAKRESASTIEIGNKLEDLVADFLRTDILSGAYGIPSRCRVLQKEKYWSAQRNDHIIVDVAVEVFHPGATQRSLLWYVECKNESRPAEVEAVETLCARMDQIAGGATKGLLVSRAGFQRAAINYARSKGVALMRWAEGQFTWELRRERGGGVRYTTRAVERIGGALAGEPLEAGMTPTPILTTGGAYSASLVELLLDEPTPDLRSPRHPPAPSVPFLSADVLDARAASLLADVDYRSGRVALEGLLALLQAERGLVVREQARSASVQHVDVLASLRFAPLELVLHPHDGLPPASRRFTIAHEIGHILLDHSEYLVAEICRESDASLAKEIDHVDVARMEVQANLFAASLLLPKDAVAHALRPLAMRLNLIDKGHGLLFLDKQPANQRAWGVVASVLCGHFDVSPTVLRLRLRALGVLNDDSPGPQALREILARRDC